MYVRRRGESSTGTSWSSNSVLIAAVNLLRGIVVTGLGTVLVPGHVGRESGLGGGASPGAVKRQFCFRCSTAGVVVEEWDQRPRALEVCRQGSSRRLKPQRRIGRHPGGEAHGFNIFRASRSGHPDVWVRSRTRCGVSITVQNMVFLIIGYWKSRVRDPVRTELGGAGGVRGASRDWLVFCLVSEIKNLLL